MDNITILLIVAAALLLYQLFIRVDEDALDNRGREIYKKRRTRRLYRA